MEQRTANLKRDVGTTTTQLISRLTIGKRILFTITNISKNGAEVYISFGEDAILEDGLLLSPGGYYQEVISEGFTPTKEQINAISNIAGAKVAITHRVEGGI